MSVENEVHQLRERVSELERRLDFMYHHLGIDASALPGTKAGTVSPAVRVLVRDYRIIDAMARYSQESEGARDLSNEEIAQIFQEETGEQFDPKKAR
jgi:hypothetical protein